MKRDRGLGMNGRPAGATLALLELLGTTALPVSAQRPDTLDPAAWRPLDPERTLYMELPGGPGS